MAGTADSTCVVKTMHRNKLISTVAGGIMCGRRSAACLVHKLLPAEHKGKTYCCCVSIHLTLYTHTMRTSRVDTTPPTFTRLLEESEGLMLLDEFTIITAASDAVLPTPTPTRTHS